MLAEGCGERAFTLVDLGHHLPNTNIEQIVAILMMKGKLGGFHFNDSKYGDDDLTCGSIKPYQLFLIFNELVDGMENNENANPPLAWMIDASHNIKDPLEDLMQSLEAIRIAYAQALLVDRKALEIARAESDVIRCQEILQTAYRTDVRPLLAEARRLSGGVIDPIGFYRKMDIRKNLIMERGMHSISSDKKCFLFDENYQEVWKEYVRFDEIKDEDGHLCDNIALIENWMITTFKKVISLDQYNVKAVNFSTYGASFVHINDKGEPVAPLYNYLKPLPEDILNQFYAKYGSEMALAKETASPPLQMLNSGMQLYYLKYAKPEIFNKIRWSLHLPQYLSFLFNRKPVSEYTSIGCHTMLWDYSKNDYHRWVYEEGIDKILPPVAQDETSLEYTYEGKKRFKK